MATEQELLAQYGLIKTVNDLGQPVYQDSMGSQFAFLNDAIAFAQYGTYTTSGSNGRRNPVSKRPTRSSPSSLTGDFVTSNKLGQRQQALGQAQFGSEKAGSEIAYGNIGAEDLVLQRMAGPQRILVSEEIRSFAAGLITDLSPLQEVSNGTIDELNMLIIDDGSRARRRGLNYETGYMRTTTGHINMHGGLWYSAEDGKVYVWVMSADTNTTSVLTQNMKLSVFEVNSSGDLGAAIDTLASTTVDYAFDRDVASWTNDLYFGTSNVAGTTTTGGRVYYYNGATLSGVSKPIFIRDYWGVDDGLTITNRPSSLTRNHLYNLVNQGWTWDDIDAFHTVVGAWPSNADLPWYGKLGQQYQIEELKTIPATGGAPKGSVILNAQQMDRSASTLYTAANSSAGGSATGTLNTDDDQLLTWLFATEFGGRVVWATQRNVQYARTASSNDSVPDMETILFFSQTITHPGNAVNSTDPSAGSQSVSTAFNCHTLIDPTSEFFEATAADGGFYSIPDVGKIMGLRTVKNTLLVIADNGIWAVGSAGGIFDPINSSITKISGVGCESARSIVTARDNVFYKGLDGIWSLASNGSQIVADKVSEGQIEVWLGKYRGQFHDGIYDPVFQEVRWLVHKNVEPGATGWAVTGNELKQQELIYNLATGTFSVNRFPNVTLAVSASPTATTVTSGTYIAGYIPLPTPVIQDLPDRNDGSTTTADVTRHTPVDIKRSTVSFKYIVVDSVGFTFADYTTDTYTDFILTKNEEMEAYLITLYDNDSDSMHKKQVGHITTHFYRTELGVEDPGGGYVAANQGSCLLDYYWDSEQRTPTENSTRRREIYKLLRDYTVSGASDPYDYGQAIITTKNKIRGRGRMLQLEFRSSTDKDLQILGWGITKKFNRRG